MVPELSAIVPKLCAALCSYFQRHFLEVMYVEEKTGWLALQRMCKECDTNIPVALTVHSVQLLHSPFLAVIAMPKNSPVIPLCEGVYPAMLRSLQGVNAALPNECLCQIFISRVRLSSNHSLSHTSQLQPKGRSSKCL